jgi:homoserine kinase
MPESESVSVRVPATSANLGAGFDCLGLALDLWSTVTVHLGRDNDADPMARMAFTAARRVFIKAGIQMPRQMGARYEGDIPIARGLGASAVARVGGLVAANELAGKPLSDDQLLEIGTELESHADNVAPALFGGFQVSVVKDGRVLHTGAPFPGELRAVLFVPDLRMPTKESRKLLPSHLTRGETVHNSSRSALLVAAFASGRFDLLDTAVDDKLHQPARAKMFPEMYAIFDAAKAAGAHCAYLSGGGSTLCALATEREEAIADAMLDAARIRNVEGRTIVTKPTAMGAHVG